MWTVLGAISTQFSHLPVEIDQMKKRTHSFSGHFSHFSRDECVCVKSRDCEKMGIKAKKEI